MLGNYSFHRKYKRLPLARYVVNRVCSDLDKLTWITAIMAYMTDLYFMRTCGANMTRRVGNNRRSSAKDFFASS